MSNEQRPKTQQRFDLYHDIPAEVQIRDLLDVLADVKAQRDFIIMALNRAINDPTTRIKEQPIRYFLSKTKRVKKQETTP